MDAWHYWLRGRGRLGGYVDYGSCCNGYYNYEDDGSIDFGIIDFFLNAIRGMMQYSGI